MRSKKAKWFQVRRTTMAFAKIINLIIFFLPGSFAKKSSGIDFKEEFEMLLLLFWGLAEISIICSKKTLEDNLLQRHAFKSSLFHRKHLMELIYHKSEASTKGAKSKREWLWLIATFELICHWCWQVLFALPRNKAFKNFTLLKGCCGCCCQAQVPSIDWLVEPET